MTYDIICVGASWGGLRAVRKLLADIPADIDQPIVIAQHRHPDVRDGGLAEVVAHYTRRTVTDVHDKMSIARNHV